jgi:predicted DNA-binding transcriptional regulator YafY
MVRVGQKSRTRTVTAVLAAFFARNVWSQADLRREVDVGPGALVKVLRELQTDGMPLRDEKEHPHVYWSVPKTWFPEGVLFKQQDVPDLLRQLRRLPRGKVRDRLLGVLTQQLPRVAMAAAPLVGRATSDQEEQYGPVVEDAAARKIALSMRYFTASRNAVTQRHVSVHLVDVGPPARFIGTCHRNGDLRWFRVDGIWAARPDEREPFRPSPARELEAFRAASLDGFKGAGNPVACSFFVRTPESSWVSNNLLEGMRVESFADGIRVEVATSAVLRLARYVVSLGGAARPETAALAEAVAELARGALEQLRPHEEPSESASARGTPAQPASDV